MNPSATDSVTVLYIMGLWRSGSTILDIFLGNHDKLVSVGELRSLPMVTFAHGEVCACGEPAETCGYWIAVRQRWNERLGGDRASRLMELQNRFERIRSIPMLLAGGLVVTSAGFREYGEVVRALYLAIADVSGKSIVVDSSKYPGRALALWRTSGIRLHLVHLVRDGRAVIWSCHRKPNTDIHGNVIQMPPEEVARHTTRHWLRVNMLSSFSATVMRRRAVRLRYEDLVTRPEPELERIGRLLDLDLRPLAQGMVQGKRLEVGHMIAGNRVRLEGAVQLRPDLEWREKLPDADRREFWKRAGWLARRYGYEK